MKTIFSFIALLLLSANFCLAQDIDCTDFPALHAKFKAIRDSDQNSRLALIKQMQSDQAKLVELTAQMRESDKNNQAFIGHLLDRCGWPQGLESLENNTIFLVIDHADTAFMSKYFPLLKQQTDAGVVQKSDLATLEDRMLMRKGLPQVYGTQTFKNTQTQVTTVWPVADAEHLAEKRLAMGLPTMEAYIEMVKNMYHTEVTWERTLTVEGAQRVMRKQP